MGLIRKEHEENFLERGNVLYFGLGDDCIVIDNCQIIWTCMLIALSVYKLYFSKVLLTLMRAIGQLWVPFDNINICCFSTLAQKLNSNSAYGKISFMWNYWYMYSSVFGNSPENWNFPLQMPKLKKKKKVNQFFGKVSFDYLLILVRSHIGLFCGTDKTFPTD